MLSQPKYGFSLCRYVQRVSCLKLEIKEVSCYEVKIEESEKGRQYGL